MFLEGGQNNWFNCVPFEKLPALSKAGGIADIRRHHRNYVSSRWDLLRFSAFTAEQTLGLPEKETLGICGQLKRDRDS